MGSQNVPLARALVASNHFVRATTDVGVRVSVEFLKALGDLVLIVSWRAIAHVVQHLLANLRVLIFSKLENTLPKCRFVVLNAARTHLLGCFQSYEWVVHPC